MATRLPNYQMRDGRTRLGQSYFNPIWADLDSRLDALERIRMDWNRQVAQLRDLGLKRIDEYIRPVIEEVNAILEQAHTDTDGLAAALVDEHITPLVTQVNAILEQARHDTNGLAQALVDEHIAPILAQARQLLSDIQSLKQTAREYVDTLAAYPAEHLLGQLRDVDGPGSGLDADTVDGKHSGDFATAQQGALAEGAAQKAYVNRERLSRYGSYHSGSSNADIDAAEPGDFGLYSTGGLGTYPSGHAFWLISTQRQYSNDAAYQFATAYDPIIPCIAYRNRDRNKNWGPWVKVFHSGDMALPRYDLDVDYTNAVLDLGKYQIFRVSINTNPTLTFANAPGAGRAMTVVVTLYGNNGTVTWPSGIAWSGGHAPELLATRTTVTLMWNGLDWTGFVSGGID